MKKNIFRIIGLLIFLMSCVCGCNRRDANFESNVSVMIEEEKIKEPENNPMETVLKNQEEVIKNDMGLNDLSDITTITWVMPNLVEDEKIESKLMWLNDALLDNGYHFALEIIYLPWRTYRQDVLEMLEKGEVDIVSVGVDLGNGSLGFAQDFIREGYFEELSEYLETDDGLILKKWYCEAEWKRVETDGEYFVFPSQEGMGGSGYLAFNKKYVSENEIYNLYGTPGELKELLANKKLPSEVYGVLGEFAQYSLASTSGVAIDTGVFFNLETGVAENPFTNELFYLRMQEMNSLYKDGYLFVTETLEDEKKYLNALENGDYVVWINYSKDSLFEEIKDTVYILPMKFYASNALSGTNGINRNSTNKDAALELLTLLYTDETYANLLIFGKEGEEYQLVNGYVCDMAGQNINYNKTSVVYGIYDVALPCVRDNVAIERRKIKNQHYGAEYYLDSAILGFQSDCTRFDANMRKAMRILFNNTDIWKEVDFEAAWAKAAAEFEAAGGNELVEELNRQITEWMQKTKNK